MNAPRPPLLLSPPARGAASLIVVMLLFFIMALAGAYASRNLIFEQRTSSNQYRALQAQEAAEAGLEWAIARLNGGRIGDDCLESSATLTDTSFRQRYLRIYDDGFIEPVREPVRAAAAAALPLPDQALNAACVFDGTDWRCHCPTDRSPSLAAPAGSGPFPAFQVRMSLFAPVAPYDRLVKRPGVVIVESNGCTRLELAADTRQGCLNFPGRAQDLEGRATSYALVALKSAIATPPVAALTVRDDVAAASLLVVNTDAERGGLTVQAGGAVDTSRLELHTAPGSTGKAVVELDELMQDPALSSKSLRVAVPPLNGNRVFASVFGLFERPFRQQPAAVQFTCPPGDCRAALSLKVAQNPGRVIWIDGDLRLDSAGDIGTPPDPADPAVTGPTVLVVGGNLLATAGADVRIHGFVYSKGGAWTGTPTIRGAAFVDNRLAATAGGRIVFDRAVIDALQFNTGSFVRVSGGWRDFQ